MVLGSKRTVNKIILILAMVIFAYAYYLKSQNTRNPADTDFATEIILHEASEIQDVNIKQETAQSTNNSNIKSEKETLKIFKPSLTFAEYKELNGWENDHGYFSAKDDAVYETYDESTLRDLSAAGDLHAMMVLGSYYIQKDFRPEESYNQLYRATLYGATASIPRLALAVHDKMLLNGTDKNIETREQGVVQIMAYLKVAAMRGDPRASVSYINSFKNTYKIHYGEELKFTPGQLDKIDIKAKEIYSRLLQSRQELGLGDFDNSTPETVKKDYAE